jgi:hypothetical protein
MMKRFLAIYTGAPAAMSQWNELPERERQKRQADGMVAWKRWAEEHKESIVEMGGPLGRTKRIAKTGVSDVRNNMMAFAIVEAESSEAAARLFMNHPHFTIFPGDGVEVMECLPIPEM